MSAKTSRLLPLCCFSLIFSIDTAIQGLIAAFGILIFYPPLVIGAAASKKMGALERGYMMMLFISVLLMGLYLDFAGSFDSAAVEELLYRVPASMAACPFFILGFGSRGAGSSAERERHMISEGLTLALIVAAFAFIRDIFLHQSLKLTFAGWGLLIPLALPSMDIPPRAAGMMLMALFLGLLSIFEEAPHA